MKCFEVKEKALICSAAATAVKGILVFDGKMLKRVFFVWQMGFEKEVLQGLVYNGKSGQKTKPNLQLFFNQQLGLLVASSKYHVC